MDNRRGYVYQHVCVSTGEVFYVGIGCSARHARAGSDQNRNRIWKSYVAKHGPWRYEILADGLAHEEVCSMEIELIAKHGRLCDGSGRLTNVSLGGDRTFWGVAMTQERKDKVLQGACAVHC